MPRQISVFYLIACSSSRALCHSSLVQELFKPAMSGTRFSSGAILLSSLKRSLYSSLCHFLLTDCWFNKASGNCILMSIKFDEVLVVTIVNWIVNWITANLMLLCSFRWRSLWCFLVIFCLLFHHYWYIKLKYYMEVTCWQAHQHWNVILYTLK